MSFTSYVISLEETSLTERTSHYLNHFEQSFVAEHVKAVATKAKELAMRFEANPDYAEQAGLLHDITN